MFNKKVIKAIHTLLLITCLSTQVISNESRTGAWYSVIHKTMLNETYSWWTEIQLRYDFNPKNTSETLIRNGLLWTLPDSEIGLLYALVTGDNRKEHRITLQHIQSYGVIFDMNITQRISYEYRMQENQDTLVNRLRFRLKAETTPENNSNLIFWNEVFINTEESSNFRGVLNHNRLFLGIKLPLSANINIELGYLNLYTPRKNGDIIEHNIMMSTYL